MATKSKDSGTFSKAEKDAMKERAKEVKKGRGGAKKDGTADVAEKIAEMKPADRKLAERVHGIVTTVAPQLEVKTWYGMPAYAKDKKVVCFFKPGGKFDMRYAEFGFNDIAQLDDGTMWPTAFALTDLDDAVEQRIAELVKRAAGEPA